MWKYRSTQIDIDRVFIDKLNKYAKVGGVVFLLLGVVGILFPTLMTMSTVIFVSYLMLLAGISGASLTWMSNPNDWAGWLKSFALIVVALYMILYPIQGAGTLGLLFSIYYFMDAFASFGIAFSSQGQKHKLLWFFNALLSFILAIVFLLNWPFSSVWLVGFLVGVTLFFNGIALLSGGILLSKLKKD